MMKVKFYRCLTAAGMATLLLIATDKVPKSPAETIGLWLITQASITVIFCLAAGLVTTKKP